MDAEQDERRARRWARGELSDAEARAFEAEFLGDHLAIDRDRRARQGGRTERQLVHAAAAIGEPMAVALEFLAVGEPIVDASTGWARCK